MALDATPTTLTLPITGMTCAGCARRVETALSEAPGVSAASVNFALEEARVTADPAAAPVIAEIVRRTGYGVREQTARLALSGMTCAGCASRVERALKAVPGVTDATVNLALASAAVRWISGATDLAAIAKAATDAGYPATAEDDSDAAAQVEAATARAARRDALELAAAAALTLPLVAQMIGMAAGFGWHLPVWAEIALAAPVQLWIGRRFYAGAWKALRARAGNMDQLVALGTSAAFAYSLWMVATRGDAAAGHLYFEASAVVITLVLAGKALESRAKRSAAAALRALMTLRPDTARVLRGGKETELPVDQVAVGDMVIVRPGERVPVDGRIVKGGGDFDESLVTGESMPVPRGPGDTAMAGALNVSGLVRLRAERVGADTTLARIGQMVAAAQTGKAPIQRLVDRIAGIFVPAVLGIAAMTIAGWLLAGGTAEQALVAAVSVLVIACPCALGLATPTALVAGTGSAAKAGILIRDIEALERANGVTAVVFDKTGTLTEGAPMLDAIVAPGLDETIVLRLAASAQYGSEHPLGRAMVAVAETRGLTLSEPEDFAATIGEGISATVEGRAVRVGRADFAGARDAALEAEAARLEQDGATVVRIALDGVTVALAAFTDSPRAGAAAAVQTLKARGLGVAMLSGDTPAAASRLAARLGIDRFEAGVRPEGKVAALARMAEGGARVAMVGDGVNDAPALAAAEVGIAMGSGADVAREAAGITLVRPRPELVPAALEIARATARTIRENLAFAFVYNVVCIPVAALGLLSPAVAGAAMALSSLSVVGNALRLKAWRPGGTR